MKHKNQKFYEKYGNLVYTFLWDYFEPGTQSDEVEDLFQTVWVRIFSSMDLFDEKTDEHIKNSLRIITRNVVNDYFRRVHKESEVLVYDEELIEQVGLPILLETELFNVDEKKYLKRAVNSLKETEQNVIVLFYYQNKNSSTVAKLLGLNAGSVRMMLSRSYKKLKKEIERLMREEGDLDER